MIGSLATAFSFTKLMSIKVKRTLCPTCVVFKANRPSMLSLIRTHSFAIRIAYNFFAILIDSESNIFLSISVVEKKKDNAIAELNPLQPILIGVYSSGKV